MIFITLVKFYPGLTVIVASKIKRIKKIFVVLHFTLCSKVPLSITLVESFLFCHYPSAFSIVFMGLFEILQKWLVKCLQIIFCNIFKPLKHSTKFYLSDQQSKSSWNQQMLFIQLVYSLHTYFTQP